MLLTATSALSWIGVRAIRRYSLASGLVDVPGERRSHKQPTPRGAGLAIVTSVIASLLAAASLGAIPWRLSLAVAGGGAMVASVGWADDHHPLRARVRIIVHFAAAAFALWMIGVPETLSSSTHTFALGPAAWPFGLLVIVWSLNAYNFMDGVDGIAGIESLCVAGGATALLATTGQPALALLVALVAAGTVGFLPWNWPPARIFMGDVGSGFLGFSFAVLAFGSERAGGLSALAWSGLLAAFIVDATLTLVRRVINGELFYQAHRDHAYQRLHHHARWSHGRISLSVLVLNIVLALIIAVGVRLSCVGVATAGCFALTVGLFICVERIAPLVRDHRRIARE